MAAIRRLLTTTPLDPLRQGGDGDHDLVLRPGEAAEFDTRTPHWFGNPGRSPPRC